LETFLQSSLLVWIEYWLIWCTWKCCFVACRLFWFQTQEMSCYICNYQNLSAGPGYDLKLHPIVSTLARHKYLSVSSHPLSGKCLKLLALGQYVHWSSCMFIVHVCSVMFMYVH